MTKKLLVKRFDDFIESTTSTIINWFWKSGLLGIVIVLLVQNLSIQDANNHCIIKHHGEIVLLIEADRRISYKIEKNSLDIQTLRDAEQCNSSDIKYLRRDIDSLLHEETNGG